MKRRRPSAGGDRPARPADADRVLTGAVIAGDIKTVRTALAGGADPNLVIAAGETVLMRAIAHDSDTQIVRMLLARGARVDAADDVGRTALHHAALAGRRDVAEVLLARGARSDARTIEGKTPLALALQYSWNLDLVDLFRARGGSAVGGEDAGRALVIAASQGDHARVFQLVAEGVDPAALTEALSAAALRGDVTLGRGLIDAGARPGGLPRRQTPLHTTAWHGQAAFARLLLDAGVDVNARDLTGKTPLHVAVITTSARPPAIFDMVRMLLDAGADARSVDQEGYSVRAAARACGRTALVAMLPAGPGEPPIDETAAGIATLLVGSADGVQVFFRPNDVAVPFALTAGHPKDPSGFDASATMAATRYREDLVKGGAGWFMPVIDAMPEGRWPTYAEVEAACRERLGRPPEVRRFAPWP